MFFTLILVLPSPGSVVASSCRSALNSIALYQDTASASRHLSRHGDASSPLSPPQSTGQSGLRGGRGCSTLPG